MSTQLTQLPQAGTVHANGQELYYEVHGDGPPLVLVMGIGYDSSIWTLAQLPVLSTQFQVILVDNRDAGRSSQATQPYQIADMADDLAGVLDALGTAQISPAGVVHGRHDRPRVRPAAPGPPGSAGAGRYRSSPSAQRRRSHRHLDLGQDARRDRGSVRWATVGRPSSALPSRGTTRPVRDTAELLASNPYPVGPEAYARQAAAYRRVRCARAAVRDHRPNPRRRG